MALIKGYPHGSNITVLNTIYKYPERQEDGKYGNDKMFILYKDLDTGEKKVEEIDNPEYRFYKSKDDVYIDHNLFFIEKDKVDEYRVPYKDLLKNIAELTDNTEFFYDNIKNGNRRDNEDLHSIPQIFNSDMHIEDAYRFYFDLDYKNETFPITKGYLDIEVDTAKMLGDFPELGECPINAVSYIDDKTKMISIFLLRDKTNPLIAEFENNINPALFAELKSFVANHLKNAKKTGVGNINEFDYEFYFYDEDKEIKLIRDLFLLINMKEPDFVIAWNMPFDIPYIIERVKRLGHDPAEIMCHPEVKTKICKYYIDTRNIKLPAQRGDYFTIIGKTVYLDQLVQFASRRKGQSAFDNMKLDYIGEVIAGVNKLSWSHIAKTFAEFPRKNYKIFTFYNIMDTIVQRCIENIVGDIDYIFNKCLINNTRYHKGHRQTIYLTNRAIKEFRNDDFIIGNNANRKNEKPGKFPGALVGEPLNNTNYPKMKINGEYVNIANNLDDFDYKSLYPSIAREFGIAPNTQIGKIIIDEEVHSKENPFGYDKYCRGGQFLQDLYSDNYIEFCSRWFHLAGFKDMLNDMDEYYSRYTPSGNRGMEYTSNFINRIDDMIPQDNRFIIFSDKVNDTVNFIDRYPERRDNSDMIEYLRNNVQMDIDDIDAVMRRKQRQREEDEELNKLLGYDDMIHNSSKEEE